MLRQKVGTWALCVLFIAAGLTATEGSGMYYHEIQGIVVSNDDGFIYVEGESLTGGPGGVRAFTGEAAVYDLLTGFPARQGSIEEGMAVRMSYHEDHAAAIWLNFSDENAAAFKTEVSENIRYTADGCVFLTGDGKYRIVLSPETLVIDPFAGIITPLDIHPGYGMFVWVDMVTASRPALVYPQKVVLVY
jgi:hypothetical protein